MANFYIGLNYNSDKERNNTLLKTADNDRRDIVLTEIDIKAGNKEDLILLIMAKIKEKLEKVL